MSPSNISFPVELDIDVAWGEEDAFGHLNNVIFFRYCESVRMRFLDRLGILAMHGQQGNGVILASATCDFLRPVKWPQRIVTRARCSAIGTSSFTMEYELFDQAGTMVAKGISVQVMYDHKAECKIRVPDRIRTVIAEVHAD